MSLPPIPEDFIDRKYGSKNGVDLWLRIYPARGHTTPRPWLMWTHGGSFCSGQHYHVRTWLYPLLQSLGVHLVSIAYRLGPVVGIDDQLMDGMDARDWCEANLNELLAPYGGCDVKNAALGGDSSGGSLALLLGLCFREGKTKAMINVYGVSDLVLQQAMYDSQPDATTPWEGTMSEEEVKRHMEDRDPSHAITASKNFWNLASLPPDLRGADHDTTAKALRKIWKVSDGEWNPNHRASEQWDIKGYITHTKTMVSSAYRIDPAWSAEKKKERLEAYTLRKVILQQTGYAPTVILHGTADQAVPVQESKDLATHLREVGVDVEELYCPGVGHGWDNIYTGPEVEGWNEYIAPIGAFLAKHLGI